MFWKSKWGIHPEYNKTVTAAKAIETGKLPAKVIIPVRQHIGSASLPVVAKGDHVKKGQLISAAEGTVSSNMHASISGTVSEILTKHNPVYGSCLSIVIESDGKDEWLEGVLTERDWTKLSTEEMLDCIRKSGIVGMGGAAFPTHVKLQPPKEKKIDMLIINAAECEPFLTVDHRIMLESADRLKVGVAITAKILGVEKVVIGIEDNKMDAVKKLTKVFKGTAVQIVAVPTRYPQGAEKMLIKTLVDREVEPGRLPMDVGIVVQNISTTVAICDAVTKNIPLIERVVTVSGGAVREPKNLLLRIGTSFSDAINMCGGFRTAPSKVIMGGPMMGISQYTIEVPVVKGTSGILVLSKKDVRAGRESACIRCGRCIKNCPMGLNPGMLSTLGEREFVDEAKEIYYLFDCIECGSCSFNCPARRNIVHYIKYSKRLSAEKAAQKQGGSVKA
jgi:Na+-translocating ferredoxin:NAD+ oxidoreductase subunit C